MARSTETKERKIRLAPGDPEQAYQLPDLSFQDDAVLAEEEQEAWDEARAEEEESRKNAEDHEDKVGRERAKAAEAEAKQAEKTEAKQPEPAKS